MRSRDSVTVVLNIHETILSLAEHTEYDKHDN